MSIETLIEAAEFVDNVETSTADEGSNTSDSQIMTSSQSNIITSKDVTIQHWRKRAVAQSVKEQASKTSDISKDENSNHEKLGTSTQEVSSPTQKETVFKKPLTSLPTSTKSENAVPTTDDQGKRVSAQRNGAHGTDNLNEPHTSFPMAVAQATAVVAAPLLYASVPLGTFAAVHGANSLGVVHGSMPSMSGEVSGTPSKSLPGHRTTYDLPSDMSRKKTQLGAITREAHNKLEKSRRAHLKGCYHKLRSVVPNLRSKVSNLVILQEAFKYVQELKQRSAQMDEQRSALMKQKATKELRLQTLKGELLKYMKPSELDVMLKRVGQNGIFKSQESGTESTRTAALPTEADMAQTLSSATPSSASSNTTLGQPPIATQASVHPSTSILRTPASVTPLLISSRSASSSNMNLVWENSNDFRRVCTMLPAPQMLSSAQICHKTDGQLFVKPSVSSNVPQRSSPVSSLTHFKPISANSESLSNVKSYTGWNLTSAEMPSFMEGRRSPLKIVVKPVDSAKQQARVSKPTSSHQKLFKTVSHDDTKFHQKSSNLRSKPSELIFRPRSSITPPPPSNITPYFPRFSVGSGGSPPLTTIFPNMSDGSSQSVGEEKGRTHFNDWGSGARSDTELCITTRDMNEIIALKRKMEGALPGTKDSKLQKPDGSKAVNISHTGVPYSSNILEASKASSQITNKIFSGPSAGMTSSLSPVRIPVTTPSFSSPLSSRSVTQVCFSTLTNTKPAIPTSSHEVVKSGDVSSPVGHFALPTMPAVTLRSPNQNSQSNRYQFPISMMTPIMSPSSGYMPVATSLPGPSGSRPSSASSTDSQPGPCVKIPAPQVQYVIPMGYPGMIAMPSGTPMAFPQPVGGFIPMMPSRGQGCGYVMPPGMMMMKRPETPSEPTSSAREVEAAAAETSGDDSRDKSTPVQNGGMLSPNKGMQPVMMAVQPGFLDSNAKRGQNTPQALAPQQVQIMSPSFQPANPIMMPVAADQSGAFMFGGAPAMIAPGQGAAVGYQMPMNIIGYPVQFGGTPSMQFAMPQGSVAMPRGFSFGFAGGVQPGMMAVRSTVRSRHGSMSGSDVESANPT